MEKEELQYMRELRAENSQKVERGEELKTTGAATSPVLYCFCRRPEPGYMLQCELCNEWYHASCLHLPKGKQGSVEKDSTFVCNVCVRTRRPRLDGLVSQLISLKKIPVVITDGAGATVPGGEGHRLAEESQGVQKASAMLLILILVHCTVSTPHGNHTRLQSYWVPIFWPKWSIVYVYVQQGGVMGVVRVLYVGVVRRGGVCAWISLRGGRVGRKYMLIIQFKVLKPS